MLDAPRLHPRTDALFKIGDNALGNAGVNVFSLWCAGHCLCSFGFEVHAHEPLPTGEVGGSKAQGRRAGRGITQAAQPRLVLVFCRGRKPGDTRPGGEAPPLCCAWGDAPSNFQTMTSTAMFLRKGSLPDGRDSALQEAR